LAEIEAELSVLLGRPVDLRTADELSPHFRQAVESAAEVQFAA
jgi:predicted nucleotidyltransferase